MPPPTVTMGPPPRPHPAGSSSHHADSSLTLPPLQTVPRGLESPGTTHAKSVEAMVMSISVLNKIRVLAKISPPLAPPIPSSPKHATRGFVIAIEGADTKAVEQVTSCLVKVLELSHPVQVFEGPNADKGSEGGSFTAYLRTIEEYHKLSSEVVAFIATRPENDQEKEKEKLKDDPTEEKEEGEISPPIKNPKHIDTHMPDATPPPPHCQPAIPIALLPTYQLTHTDTAASRIPIRDAYAPVDHWQWMATLWRGIVGADITVVVRERGCAGERGPAKDSEGAGGKGKREEPEVEVRLEDARTIVVRGEKGKSEVGEGGLRRVGFEVGEWVRGGGR